jgi:hypothetical protein
MDVHDLFNVEMWKCEKCGNVRNVGNVGNVEM